MKTFATALLLASANAVDVMKARVNPAYAAQPEYTVVEDQPVVVTEATYEPAAAWEPAPRYWDRRLQYEGPTWVDFSTPEPFVAPAVSYELPKFLPYIPKYKSNYVDVVAKDSYQEYGDLFKPYEFYSPPTEELYGDPIYEPKNDKLHQKPPKKEAEEDAYGQVAEAKEAQEEEP